MRDFCPSYWDIYTQRCFLFEKIGFFVFIKHPFPIDVILCEKVHNPLLLFGREPTLPILVTVVCSFAAKIVSKGDANVVTRITALHLGEHFLEPACQHQPFRFLEISALTIFKGMGQYTQPSCHLMRCTEKHLMSQAAVCHLTLAVRAYRPPVRHLIEINITVHHLLYSV